MCHSASTSPLDCAARAERKGTIGGSEEPSWGSYSSFTVLDEVSLRACLNLRSGLSRVNPNAGGERGNDWPSSYTELGEGRMVEHTLAQLAGSGEAAGRSGSLVRLSPKYRHTSDAGPNGKAASVDVCASEVIGAVLQTTHFVTTGSDRHHALRPQSASEAREQGHDSQTPARVPSTNARNSSGEEYATDVVLGSPLAIGGNARSTPRAPHWPRHPRPPRPPAPTRGPRADSQSRCRAGRPVRHSGARAGWSTPPGASSLRAHACTVRPSASLSPTPVRPRGTPASSPSARADRQLGGSPPVRVPGRSARCWRRRWSRRPGAACHASTRPMCESGPLPPERPRTRHQQQKEQRRHHPRPDLRRWTSI